MRPPPTGLHPADIERLIARLNTLVDAGNTGIMVEHDMHMIASGDWVIDMGPGACDAGGTVVAAGNPDALANGTRSRTAPYLRLYLESAAPA